MKSIKTKFATNHENDNDANRLLADSFLPTLDKKNFRQWMLGMMMQELDVPFKDLPKILKLQKCTQEIIRFAEEEHLLVNDVRAMLDEHAKCVLSDVSTRLSSSLGEAEGNAYEVVFDKDDSFWIYHKDVGSGEPLKQWIDGVLNVR